MNIQTFAVPLRHLARSVGFEPMPRTATELVEAVCRHYERYLYLPNDELMYKDDKWGGHGGYFVPRVILRVSGQEFGWIEDVEITDGVALFGHFAVPPAFVRTGLARAMILSYLKRLISFYNIQEAVFDLQRVRGGGTYEQFFTGALLATRDPNTPTLFRWRRAPERP